MRPNLEWLCSHLGDALREVRPIAVTADVDNIQLPTEQAASLGLIVNEQVTKHSSMHSPTSAAVS